ncbi:MAG: phosphopantothenoylcysteine decarboxylase [Candidatus Omnitrophota bacterium]
MTLKNKKILITAGPTQVKIDPVRAISNIATGETGRLLAKLAKERGAKVTLLLAAPKERIKGIRLKSFRYFKQLRSLVKDEIKKNKFDCIIHNAAVSDFLLEKESKKKLDSNKTKFSLKLIRAPKIINEIKKCASNSFLVMFKLEPNVSDTQLIKRARTAQEKAAADIIVANKFKNNRLKSFILNHQGMLAKSNSRLGLARKLISILEEKI